jgi:hypothetical protein
MPKTIDGIKEKMYKNKSYKLPDILFDKLSTLATKIPGSKTASPNGDANDPVTLNGKKMIEKNRLPTNAPMKAREMLDSFTALG